MDKKAILWFSAGSTSAVACKIAVDRFGKENVRIIYFKIKTAHPDNNRFIKECEKWYDKEIEQVSGKYLDQFDVIEKTKYVNGAKGARCTMELKRKIREMIQKEGAYKCQVFGFEDTPKERIRAERIPKDAKPIFPLIENNLSKPNCLGILEQAGIRLPEMYKLGYPNNNCIGCVKGGMGYWNKVRVDFPSEFRRMATLERKVGRTCLKESDGTRIFLDELDPNRGNILSPIIPDCGFFCGDTGEYI